MIVFCMDIDFSNVFLDEFGVLVLFDLVILKVGDSYKNIVLFVVLDDYNLEVFVVDEEFLLILLEE